MRLVKAVDGRNGSSFGLAHAVFFAVVAALAAVVMALLLPLSVFASPQPPVTVGTIPDQEVVRGGTITVDVADYFSDPDGANDTLGYGAMSETPAVVENTVAGRSVDGSVVTVTVVEAVTSDAAEKTATIVVTATDLSGNPVEQEFDVTVVANTAPTAEGSIPRQTVVVGGTRTLNVSTYFSDSDVADRGDKLTYTATPTTGASDAKAIAEVETDPNGNFVEITAQSVGVEIITVTASDLEADRVRGDGDMDTVPVTATRDIIVRVTANRAPTADGSIPDMQVIQGGKIEIDAADYFSDPDGADNPLRYQATVPDPDDNTVVTTPDSDPADGMIVIDGSMVTITVSQTAAKDAKTTVTVTATDAATGVAFDADDPTQTFEVTVLQNKPPVKVKPLPNLILVNGGVATLDAADYFSDPDVADRGDELSYSVAGGSDSTAEAVFGTGDDDTSVLTITGRANDGEATIVVTASDSGGTNSITQEFDVTLQANNDLDAVEKEIPDRTLVVGRSITFDASDYFSDPDVADRGDKLSYTGMTRSSDETVATVTTEDDSSMVTIKAEAPGVTIVTVRATDLGGNLDEQAFVVRVVANSPPARGASIPDQTLVMGENGMVDVAGHFSDPDVAGRGDELSYTARSSDDTVAAVTVSDSSVVTIAAVSAGTAVIVVTATDSSGATAEQTIVVMVNMPEPVMPEPVMPAPVMPAPVMPAPVMPAPVMPAPVGPVMNEDGCTIWGDEEDNVIIGTSGDDVICGYGGNDVIRGGAGNDVIRGGAGNDVIRGGAGNDVIRGGAGDDRLLGKAGNDMLFGGAGDDMLRGGPGNDMLGGGSGDDMLRGGPGNDMLRGGPGNDMLRGGSGEDMLRGGSGNNVLRGG